MSSFTTTLLNQHLHRLDAGSTGHQLSTSQRAADRFALLQAVREQQQDQRRRRPRRSGQRLRRLLTARSRAAHGTSPA